MVKTCEACGGKFAGKATINGKIRSLYRRRFCLACSPFGSHNTSKSPPGIAVPEELKEHRRLRRNAKIYRWQKRHRRRQKAELIEARGGRCGDCGYSLCAAALEFHHRDPAAKEFGVGTFNGSCARILAEAEKCDLVCANCHRLRHAARDRASADHATVQTRREKKERAIASMGGVCFGCRRDGSPSLFEFHHKNPTEKDFGISEDGISRNWDAIARELAKCVMLCANCHREVHAGVRRLEQDQMAGLLSVSRRTT